MRLLTISLALLVHTFSLAQEFELHENGLIYSDTTINQLKGIVDSLNLKHAVCEEDPKYFSKLQTTGYLVSSSLPEKKLKQFAESGYDLKALKDKDARLNVGPLQLFVSSKYQNYYKEEVKVVDSYTTEGHEREFRYVDEKIDIKNNWVFLPNQSDNKKTQVIYLNGPFKSGRLGKEVARKIQYGNCLIDTNQTKFFEDAESGYISIPANYSVMTMNEKLNLLDSMRSTKVVGMCSMDDSPRRHARDIAIIAAETVSWSIFLRSHLDIMNDRFHRMSDGSYAFARRSTYIKELEEINIDVPTLMIGTVLRIQNPPQNHYYSNVGRAGRAISESSDLVVFENLILNLIADKDLDLFNRLIMIYLYETIVNYTEDESKKAKMSEKIEQVKIELDEFIGNN